MLCVASIVSGCSNFLPRGQSPDFTSMKFTKKIEETTYVGNMAAPWGLNTLQVEGIALVNRLHNTGSNPPATDSRRHLVDEMRSFGVTDIDAYLAQPDNSLVLVKGFLPPGAQKGDKFDLFVVTPPRSETKSLEHGYMMEARLRTMAILGGRMTEGMVVAVGMGPLVINEVFSTTRGEGGKLEAIIPGGGTISTPRPIGLAIQRDSHSVQNAKAIERAINNRFTTKDVNTLVGVAYAKNDKLIELKLPPEYRFNLERFFRVVASTAVNESANDRLERTQRIERELHQPNLIAISAIRLEAIGKEAVPALRRALRSDDPEVRFHAAQALTYIGEPDGFEELEKVAKSERAWRWQALTALASNPRRAAEEALVRLFDVNSAETRYGAYRALLQRSPDEPMYAGKSINKSFHFVMLPSTADPLIHASKLNRHEIVMFGTGHHLHRDFLFVEKGITVKGISDQQVEIVRYLPGEPEIRVKSPSDLEILIPRLAAYGCDYGTVLKILREAQSSRTLSSKFVINALPERDRVYDRERALARNSSYGADEPSDDDLPSMYDTKIPDENSSSKVSSSKRGNLDNEVSDFVSFDSDPALSKKRKSWSIIPERFR